MGQRWDKLRGTTSPAFGVGNGRPGNKSFQFSVRDLSPPEIRWNDSLGGLEFTEDGIHFFPLGTCFIPAVFAGMSEGYFGYLDDSTGSIYKTDSNLVAKSRVTGAHVGVSGRLLVGGVVANARFADNTLPTLNAPVFLAKAVDDSGAGAGKVRLAAPTTGIVAEVGLVVAVDPLTFPSTRTASVLLQVKGICQRAT